MSFNVKKNKKKKQKGRFGRSKKYQRKGRTGLAEKSKITKDGYDSVSHIGIPT